MTRARHALLCIAVAGFACACATRDVVIERRNGRVNSTLQTMSASDAEWQIESEPAGSR